MTGCRQKDRPLYLKKDQVMSMHTQKDQNENTSYAAPGSVLLFLEKAGGKGPRLGLERISALLSLLGHPEKDLRYVHVAGTNGKGSVCAFLSSILASSGLRCGVFSSPWIQRYTEQIRICCGGKAEEISLEDLALVMEKVQAKASPMEDTAEGLPTEFELLTAAAILYFREKRCDIVVLETGMGGRLDATNVIPCPEAALLTPISMDHEAFLGSSLPAIAREKAGIIKEGGYVITSPQKEEVLSVIAGACRERGAALYAAPVPRVFSSGLDGTLFTLEGPVPESFSAWPLRIRLAGAYQAGNAALAAGAALLLKEKGFPVTDLSIRKGLENALWRGRFEVLSKDPLLIIDGAHNPDGISALTESLSLCLPGKKLIMIAGVLADKDYKSMFREMLPFAECFITVTVPNPRALSAGDLASFIRENGGAAQASPSIEEALERALDLKKETGADGMLAFGSLYYIGKIRTLMEKKGGPKA